MKIAELKFVVHAVQMPMTARPDIGLASMLAAQQPVEKMPAIVQLRTPEDIECRRPTTFELPVASAQEFGAQLGKTITITFESATSDKIN